MGKVNSYSHDKGFGDKGMNSFNHYAYGAINQWLVERLVPLYDTPFNQNDTAIKYDIYYTLTDKDDAVTTAPVPDDGCPKAVKYPGAIARLPVTDADGRPMRYGSSAPALSGLAVYGDGYAIAGFRARHGAFKHLQDVKNALTFVDRNGNGMSISSEVQPMWVRWP